MTDAIIVAVIGGAFSLTGAIIASAASTNKMISEIRRASDLSDTEIKGEIAVIKTELSALRNEVEKHNGVIERTFRLEQRAEVIEERQKVANHRIDKLERK